MIYYRPKTREECLERYGPIQLAPDKRMYWPGSDKWLKACYLPQPIIQVLRTPTSGNPVERIFCNTDMHEPLLAAMDNLIACGAHKELKTFDGSFNVRYVRGSDSVVSYHAWAIAIDLNAKQNPLGGQSDWTPAFVRCFTDLGWVWGGDFKVRKDPQHFEWVGFPKPAPRVLS